MRIKVKIDDIEIEIDRPNMSDYNSNHTSDGPSWRTSLLEGTVLPMLKEATEKVKELYNLRNNG